MFSWLKKKKTPQIQTDQLEKRTYNFNTYEAKALLAEIKTEFGLDYQKQEYITMKKIERFAIKNEITSFQELHTKISHTQELKTKLVNMLTVGETYFYRESGHFQILSDLLQEKNIQKVLCAPSSSGEEVYSILLFIKEHNNTMLHITGIDLNSDAIIHAEQGCYQKRSVSPLSEDMKKKYFTQQKNQYCIDEHFKRSATFQHQNIFDTSLKNLGTFDAIFCRNMLIYFNHAEKEKALAQLATLLSAGGLLFLGHADISFIPKGFEKKTSNHGNYFIKI